MGQTDSLELHTELEDLHATALRLVLLAVAALAVYGHFGFTAFADRVDATGFGLMWAVLATAALAFWVMRHGVALAAALLVSGLGAILAVAVLEARAPTLAYWFAPLGLVAGVLIGWRASLTLAVATTAVLVVGLAEGEPTAASGAMGPLLLTWISLLLAWLLSYPTRTTLVWAWNSYVRAAQAMEELRDHQQQLERTVRSLNHAYQRLEHLNGELARARQTADEARRLKAEFAAEISHELRTPLNLIIGFSEMMTDTSAYGGQALPAAYRADVEAIHRNACHLSSLVDDVLDLSQIEADRMGLQKERTHLAPVVDEAASVVARLYEAKGLFLRTEIPLDLPPAHVDRTRIRQVLINLLNNAVRFTTTGGVTIRGWAQGNDLVVAVHDTGSGIAPEHLPTVFDEFRQVNLLGQARIVGNGLGLALSKRFVELQGGSMWAESTPGEGSTFYFSMPACENVVAADGYLSDATLAPAASGESERTILVVDREGDAARLLRRHLDGYRVVVARGAETARRTAAGNTIEAAVVVGSDGPPDWRALRRLGETLAGVPVATCALARRNASARELGVADYLLKPIGQAQVRHTLRRLGRHVRTILVVDDDPEMVRLLARLITFTSRRYTVWEAHSGEEALGRLAVERPDAVFLDLAMPNMCGDVVLRRVRETPELHDLPVVLVTGHGLDDETITADFFGITRPDGLSVRELMHCLRATLDGVHRPQPAALQHLQQSLPPDRLGEEIGGPDRQREGALVHHRAHRDRDIAGGRVLG